MAKTPRVGHPWEPAEYDEQITGAIKSLATGTANDAQQKRALDWIVRVVCRTYDHSYRPGEAGNRDTAYAEGMRKPGLEIVKQIRLTTTARPANKVS